MTEKIKAILAEPHYFVIMKSDTNDDSDEMPSRVADVANIYDLKDWIEENFTNGRFYKKIRHFEGYSKALMKYAEEEVTVVFCIHPRNFFMDFEYSALERMMVHVPLLITKEKLFYAIVIPYNSDHLMLGKPSHKIPNNILCPPALHAL